MSKELMSEYRQVYTKPNLRKKLKDDIQAKSQGGKAGQWSARKAQLLKKAYEAKGGDYKHSGQKTTTQKNLTQWSKKSSSSQKSYIAPSQVAKAAEKGLMLRREFQQGGTRIGVTRATQLKNRKPVSMTTIKRMYSYFQRHSIDKKAKNFGKDSCPSKGYIAWLLWGGDAGLIWVKHILKSL